MDEETPTARALLEWAQTAWSDLDGLALVRAALTGPFARRIATVSSFGAESAVLLDMVASIDTRSPVLFLETGKLFPETLAYMKELVALMRLQDVRTIRPDAARLDELDRGGDLWQRDGNQCCHIRKTAPLDRSLARFVGWINGRKRFHGGTRASLPVLELDVVTGKLKLNPLANWSPDDLRHYRRVRRLPLHPLVAQGFGSIGCQPCTRPVREGKAVRAGRWPQSDKSECGIHRSGVV